MGRYARLFVVALRLSATLAAQYRAEFVIDAVLSVVWAAARLAPLLVVFDHGRSLPGWTFEEALVVVGFFTLLKGVLEGAVNPSLVAVVDRIRQGTLDFTLLKPADAQFLVSTARFEIWNATDAIAAAVIFGWAFTRMGRAPGVGDVALGLLLLVAAVVVLYSIWILVVSLSFWVVRLDNLTYFFNALFDFGRWPVTIFKGFWRVVFTVGFPTALMTTYPAQALLGDLDALTAALAIGGSAAFAIVARLAFRSALSRYTSASS